MAKKKKTHVHTSEADARKSRKKPEGHEIFTAKRLIIVFLTVEIIIIALMYPTFRGRWHMNKAKKFANEKKFEKAYKNYLWLEKKTPAADSATFNLDMGNVCMGLEKYQNAIKYYKKLIRISKGQKESFFLLGNAYLQNDNDEAALENFQKELEKNPTHPASNFNIGKLYFEQNDYTRAMHHFSRIAFIPGYQKRLKPFWDTIEKEVLEK